MITSFTGCRKGMTEQQKEVISSILKELFPNTVHHGVCIGSDEHFHLLVRKVTPACFIVGHPGVGRTGMCYTRSIVQNDLDECLKEEPFLVRDRKMVDAGDILLATPEGFDEPLRSGTCTTIRYARRIKKDRIIVYPDGSVKFKFFSPLHTEKVPLINVKFHEDGIDTDNYMVKGSMHSI